MRRLQRVPMKKPELDSVLPSLIRSVLRPSTSIAPRLTQVTLSSAIVLALSTSPLAWAIPGDDDNDGIIDSVEIGPDPANPLDSDADGVPDYQDNESDGDGIWDVMEGDADPDGDGIPNYLDLDSDGDGILDIDELPTSSLGTDSCGTPYAVIEWTHNEGNGSLEIAKPDAAMTPLLLEGKDFAIGAGLVSQPFNWEWIIQGVDGATLADAEANDDYAELAFTLSEPAFLVRVQEGLVPSNWGGQEAGNFDFAVRFSDDNFVTSTLLFDDGHLDIPPPSTYEAFGKSVTPQVLEPNVEYKIRLYYFNELNNNNPNGTITVDDIIVGFSAGCFNADADGDGTPDFLDIDSDNDGILDAIEGTGDIDGDGIPNHLDTDADGDGILDADEVGPDPANPLDSDNDGIPDYLDTDSDGDGIPDAIEVGADPAAPLDTDGDGVPNHLDTDSDGDGITDAVEAGADPTMPANGDTDGTPDYLDLDSDGDGIPDSLEGTGDLDNDGIPDYLDTDSWRWHPRRHRSWRKSRHPGRHR